ncbi:MAG TPA: 5-(carboxyamino)imidazole ribonucleotide synthase [Pyrinomonadaceae bacterium]|nr:5-(carboxyamino)imidazole ribonucleotide synthase [Chloracidobacterium sp.]MBP9934142.1 5-(carboxyamino)imidazole ribonucleotide synthase [Pyrinomonadaceae bacterium]MBK9436975.1 5-(carboxyamino)imidazole ribonucleotide synthase [Chloracidobacterium sp.]MBK9768163.1 5-(carboxyamino)imidazole ribonucleotide synthase [Chloracidobacterium sp.]MBL0241969.1 5-(carboxyamino)imidazole ribonucleotide synthase [Chloracidobacterium sp.]
MIKPTLPNSTIGVFGSGQLGRMFAIEARKLGYRVHTYSPDSDTPTGQIADIETQGSYDDLYEIRVFAQSVDVVTFEFENVPSAAVEAAAEFVDVFPRGEVLHITQNRLREKNFLASKGFPITAFRHIKALDDLQNAVVELGTPCVLKTAGFGYDGKGQSKISSAADITAAFELLGGRDAVLEAFVDFEKELSVVCARDQRGTFAHFGVIENEHANHILDVSFAPAVVDSTTFERAIEITRNIADTMGYVGTLCVEFFLTRDGLLLVNELAPRPHNSGHLTFDACVTSQFEQQLRAVCGLPLGSTDFYRPAAMANVLGNVWENGEPDWATALNNPAVKLHLYGKGEPRPGRKMGHITSLSENAAGAIRSVRHARESLKPAS